MRNVLLELQKVWPWRHRNQDQVEDDLLRDHRRRDVGPRIDENGKRVWEGDDEDDDSGDGHGPASDRDQP